MNALEHYPDADREELADALERRELSERHGRVTLYETYQAKRTIETFEKGKAND